MADLLALVRRCAACQGWMHRSCWQRIYDVTGLGDSVPCSCGCWDGCRTAPWAWQEFARRQPGQAAVLLASREQPLFICSDLGRHG